MSLIKPAQLDSVSHLVITAKQDRSLRFCVDYQNMNPATVKAAYPIPLIEEAIYSFGEVRIFSTLDINSGYWQIKIYKRKHHNATFTSHHRYHIFIRTAFGLKTHQVRYSAQWTWLYRHSSGNSLSSIFTISSYSPSQSRIATRIFVQSLDYWLMPADL